MNRISLYPSPQILTPLPLPGKLEEIGNLLSSSPLQDDLSQALRVWHREFTLRGEAAASQFLDLLEQLLTNPITHEPLDDKSWLGSDGFAYGNQFLRVYHHHAPEEFKTRSPVSPQNPALFTKKPHTIVRFLVPWLKTLRLHFHPERTERLFQQLPRESGLSRIDRIVSTRPSATAASAAREVFEEMELASLDVFDWKQKAVCEDLVKSIKELQESKENLIRENLELQNAAPEENKPRLSLNALQISIYGLNLKKKERTLQGFLAVSAVAYVCLAI